MSRVLRSAACVVAAVAITQAATVSAHASAFRYWTYWQGGGGAWTFSAAGPAFVIPPDGAVDGWRFGVTTDAGSGGAPRSEPSFEAVCGATTAAADQKRVAVVIDPGSQAEAPTGQSPPAAQTTCVVIDTDATGYDVLRSITTVRLNDKGLVCGVGGYPTGDCAEIVSDDELAAIAAAQASSSAAASASATQPTAAPAAPLDAASSPSDDAGTPWPTIGVVVIALGVVVALLWRRRRA